jgi:chromosome segregation ATPase
MSYFKNSKVWNSLMASPSELSASGGSTVQSSKIQMKQIKRIKSVSLEVSTLACLLAMSLPAVADDKASQADDSSTGKQAQSTKGQADSSGSGSGSGSSSGSGASTASTPEINKAKAAIHKAQTNDHPAALNAQAHKVTQNQKQDLHKTLRKAVEEQGTTPKQQEDAARTASAVNKLPGEKIDPKDLEHPPIKGFHPIKKLFQPISDLEKTTEKLNIEGTKLEKPMAQLQDPMLHLQKKMVTVDKKVVQMHKTLKSVSDEVTGARSDLSSIRQQMNDLKRPIVALQKPVTGVASPLEHKQLKLNMLLFFIFIFGLIVAFGTPFAAILVYRNRAKLFPTAPAAKKAGAGAAH